MEMEIYPLNKFASILRGCELYKRIQEIEASYEKKGGVFIIKTRGQS